MVALVLRPVQWNRPSGTEEHWFDAFHILYNSYLILESSYLFICTFVLIAYLPTRL